MNEMNPVETQLASWKPRRPSPNLKRRIFRQRSANPSPRLGMLQWAAPVAACCLLTFLVLREGVDPLVSSAHPFATDQPSRAASIPPYDVGHVNAPFGNRFDWTNAGAFTSSVGSFLPGRAN